MVIALAGACAGSPPPAPHNTAAPGPEPPVSATPDERSDPELVELAIRLIGEMAEAAAASAPACDEVGAAIAAIAGANPDVFIRLDAIAAPAVEERRAELDAATAALSAQIGGCAGHPSVNSAMEALAP